eukprot:1042784-Pleurochrysis_carterae.AAC.1
MDFHSRTSTCFAPPGRSWPNDFIAIGIWRWLPTYGDSKPRCVMSLKWLAKSFALNRVSLYIKGSVSHSIVSFVSLLFQALAHEEPMICHSEPIGNVLLAGPTMVLFHLAAMQQLLTSMFTYV